MPPLSTPFSKTCDFLYQILDSELSPYLELLVRKRCFWPSQSYCFDVISAGDSCEFNTNECSSNPCQNGATCKDEINKYTCECKPGYTGTQETFTKTSYKSNGVEYCYKINLRKPFCDIHLLSFLVAPLLKSGATYLLSMVSVGMCVCMYVCLCMCGQLKFNFKY